ncbi:DUF6522 family protein [Roseovarius sp. S4756]|uniref:DUF6522 family protein n=1 Tax=Roseovarius maritimus TaxID=3342637 RepID=UPI00372B521B
MSEIEISPGMIQIDADIVAKALKLEPLDLRIRMRDGTVTSRFETGEGADIGRVRLTFFSSTRRARIIADAAGSVLSCTAVDYVGAPKSPRSVVPSAAGSGDAGKTSKPARLDSLLDTALDGSFPASDPIAITFDHRD